MIVVLQPLHAYSTPPAKPLMNLLTGGIGHPPITPTFLLSSDATPPAITPALPKGNNPSANSPNPAAGNPVNPVRAGNDSFAADRPGVATPVAPVAAQWASEREAYAAARQSLTDRDFAAAVAQMEGLIVNYPNGQYTPNAFYWLGELYLAQQETERARQQFTQVINLYPDHQKVPDALFKLGVVYSNLGDSPRAKQFFNEVISQHPRSSAANLAAKYQEALE